VKHFFTKPPFYASKTAEFPVKIPKYITMADNPLSVELIIAKPETGYIIKEHLYG
jgi:hypothetical protein